MKLKFLTSGKTKDCPVCGRTQDTDCRWTADRALVLCHNNFDHENSTRFGSYSGKEEYKFIGQTEDGRCGRYVRNEPDKIPRKSETKEYVYKDVNGNPIIKVKRIDREGEGKLFFQGRYDPTADNADADGYVFEKGALTQYPEIKEQITIYQYDLVQQAIAKGEPVFWTEGEKSADYLFSLGFTATTSIGGSSGFSSYGVDYKTQISGANLIICPDMDQVGIEYTEKVEALVGNVTLSLKWCYPFSYSDKWKALPKNGGLDVADWIFQGADKDLIESSVCDKRDLTQEASMLTVREKYNRIASKIRASDTVLTDPGEKFLALRLIGQEEKLNPKDISYLQSLQPSLAPVKPESLKDFMGRAVQTVDWLVEGMIPRSSTFLLAGTPGAGKSLLMYDLIYSVRKGGMWLNKFKVVQPGRVLFLQLEEGDGFIPADRMRKRGFDLEDTGVEFLWPPKTIGDIPSVTRYCHEQKIDLCIIDSLNAINGENAVNEKDATYGLPLLHLTQSASAGITTFGVIHHKRKRASGSKEEENDIAEVRGNNSITANVQSVIMFGKAPKFGELGRKLEVVKSRFELSFGSHVIKLNPQNYSYFYVASEDEEGDSEDVGEKSKETRFEGSKKQVETQKDIYGLLLKTGKRYELSELAEILNYKDYAVRTALDKLCRDGLVVSEPSVANKRAKVYRAANDEAVQEELKVLDESAGEGEDPIVLLSKIAEQFDTFDEDDDEYDF